MAPKGKKRARSEADDAVAAPVRPLTAQDAKAIVADIKKELKAKKFYPGSYAVKRTVRFSTPRFPPNEAARALGLGAGGKGAPRQLDGDQILLLLRLKPDTLKATLYRKPHRFAKPGTPDRRCGAASLKLLSMEVGYKAGCLRGCMQCINETAAPGKGEVDVATSNAGALDAEAGSGEAAVATSNAGPPDVANAEAETGERKASTGPQQLPTVGDVVELLDTPRIRKLCSTMGLRPEVIGSRLTIFDHGWGDFPYRGCRRRSEAPFKMCAQDLRLVAKGAVGPPRRILEVSGCKLKLLCGDSISFVNFHRALQTCIQSCKGVIAKHFLFEFNGKSIGSDSSDDARALSELRKGDVVTYTSEFNPSYGKSKLMVLKVCGEHTVSELAMETPWTMLKYLDDDLLPRCVVATADKARDVANWRLCHMRFDLVKPLSYFEHDDLSVMRMGVDSSLLIADSCRRGGPPKSQREKIVRRMSLDLAGEHALLRQQDGCDIAAQA